MNDLAVLYGLIKRFEGCKLVPYLCPAGIWTAGWGSTGLDVFPGRAWTQAYADARLAQDAERFAVGTLALCPRLDGDRLAAIADFAYNAGLGRLKSSTLRKRLNAQEFEAAKVELRKWVNAAGRKLPGLIIRRETEAGML